MRFVMINLFIVFLLFFGIGYLAFGHEGTLTAFEPHADPVNETSSEASQELLKTDREAARLEHQGTAKHLFRESVCRTFTFLIK